MLSVSKPMRRVLLVIVQEMDIDVQFRWDAKGAFYTLPDELRMEKDTFAGGDGPYEIRSEITVDLGEMANELSTSPTSGIRRERTRIIFVLVSGKSLREECEKLCIWWLGDDGSHLRGAMEEGQVDIVWERGECSTAKSRSRAVGSLPSEIDELIWSQAGFI